MTDAELPRLHDWLRRSCKGRATSRTSVLETIRRQSGRIELSRPTDGQQNKSHYDPFIRVPDATRPGRCQELGFFHVVTHNLLGVSGFSYIDNAILRHRPHYQPSSQRGGDKVAIGCDLSRSCRASYSGVSNARERRWDIPAHTDGLHVALSPTT